MKIYLILSVSLLVSACAQTGLSTKSSSNQGKPVSTTKIVEQPAINKTVYQLSSQVQQQQKELQQLRGQIEEQTFTISDLKKRQHATLSDFDKRLQKIEASTMQPGLAVERTRATRQPVLSKAVPPSEEALSQKVTGIEKQVYLAAYANLRSGHTDQAITMFNQVIDGYPKGEYADNAQYWLGEAYKIKQDSPAAKQAFKNVINHYPDSDKVPDAMLKLAYIELDEADINSGRRLLINIIDDYNDSTAARLAETKLMQLQGENF